MSQENVEIVQRFFEASARGDFDAALGDELIDAGDCVFLAYRQSALVRGSDSRVHERMYCAVRLRDGKLAEGEVYSRRGTALEAVGLRE